MQFSRPFRTLTTLITALGFTFAQLAVAAYACPSVANALASTVQADTAAASDEMPCQSNSTGLVAGLCKAHCEQGQSNVAAEATPSPAAFMPSQMASLPIPTPHRPQPATLQSNGSALAPPLPIYLRHCVFRI